jgi:hypothetical protein
VALLELIAILREQVTFGSRRKVVQTSCGAVRNPPGGQSTGDRHH